jgi:RND superfamily putative drug exporter
MRQAVSQVAASLSRLPGVAAGIRSPLRPGGQALVSGNGRSALVTFNVPGRAADVTTAVTPALDAVAKVQASHPDLLVAEGGDASLGQAVNNQISADFGKATETSLPVTLILLAGVFGTLAAAGIPVLLALSSALTAIWLLAIPGHWLPVGSRPPRWCCSSAWRSAWTTHCSSCAVGAKNGPAVRIRARRSPPPPAPPAGRSSYRD